MSLKFERIIKRRKTEIILTIVLFILAVSLVFLSLGPLQGILIELGGKLGFSILVALIVRWLTVIFSESEASENTDKQEYHEAIKSAHKRIWISQTWLPGIEGDALEIVYSKASDIRILLLSFKDDSPIYSRIKGRKGLSSENAKYNSASSVRPFVEEKMTGCIRFNHDHHPGWIAVIDSWVFTGPIPVDRDSHGVEYLFHKYSVKSREGEFWQKQFELLWSNKHSHSFEDEKQYNEKLSDY